MKDRFEELYQEIPELVIKINIDLKPKWGKMHILQMIEHLTTGFELSLSYVEYDILTPKEKLPAYIGFLMSNKPFPEGTQMPKEYETFPKPKKQSLELAKERFLEKLRLLKKETEANPDFWFNHPNFGKLNAEQTLQLHIKHIRHHFKQFGLMQTDG